LQGLQLRHAQDFPSNDVVCGDLVESCDEFVDCSEGGDGEDVVQWS
jgi:hypothetical protein